jgi:hypothetical protein
VLETQTLINEHEVSFALDCRKATLQRAQNDDHLILSRHNQNSGKLIEAREFHCRIISLLNVPASPFLPLQPQHKKYNLNPITYACQILLMASVTPTSLVSNSYNPTPTITVANLNPHQNNTLVLGNRFVGM